MGWVLWMLAQRVLSQALRLPPRALGVCGWQRAGWALDLRQPSWVSPRRSEIEQQLAARW